MKEKYQAVLVGCAIGDTLGMPVESWNRGRIKKYFKKINCPVEPFIPFNEKLEEIKEDEFGKVKIYSKGLKKGDYTDDTILTFALARALVEKGLNLENIALRQLQEYELRLNQDGTCSGGFGGTTIEGFKNLQKGISPLESGIIGGPGNAPAMKMAPLGIYMHSTKKSYDGLKFAEKIGMITHLDPRSIASGVIQAYSIYNLLNNFLDRKEFTQSLVRICERWEKPLDERHVWNKAGGLFSRMKWISQNSDVSSKEAFEVLGNSSAVYKSYPFALFMFQKYWNNPIQGLIETINYGGDCDTTGAIYGTLAGAKNGLIFPKKWMKETQGISEALELGEKLFELGGKK
jgi:ADP-ribosylglycohydrolase